METQKPPGRGGPAENIAYINGNTDGDSYANLANETGNDCESTTAARSPIIRDKRQRWEAGQAYYCNGIDQISEIPTAIRALGYYLYVGDPDSGLAPIREPAERFRKIFDVIKNSDLPISESKWSAIEQDVRECCTWSRKGANNTNQQAGNNRIHNQALERVLNVCQQFLDREHKLPSADELVKLAGCRKQLACEVLSDFKTRSNANSVVTTGQAEVMAPVSPSTGMAEPTKCKLGDAYEAVSPSLLDLDPNPNSNFYYPNGIGVVKVGLGASRADADTADTSPSVNDERGPTTDDPDRERNFCGSGISWREWIDMSASDFHKRFPGKSWPLLGSHTQRLALKASRRELNGEPAFAESVSPDQLEVEDFLKESFAKPISPDGLKVENFLRQLPRESAEKMERILSGDERAGYSRPVPLKKARCKKCGAAIDFVYDRDRGKNVPIEVGAAIDRNEYFDRSKHKRHQCRRSM